MHPITRLCAAGLCALAVCAAQAQTRAVRPATNVVPSANALAARAAPQPSGLRPVFPAGISSGSGARTSTDPVAASAAPVPVTSVGTGSNGSTVGGIGGGGGIIPELPSVNNNSAAAAATQVLGAGPTVPGPGQGLNMGAGGFSATDLSRSWYFADANHDGDLTRAEAGRLSIAPLSFEQMDRNFDGVISRFEYDDATR
jgi:hypothetical protein